MSERRQFRPEWSGEVAVNDEGGKQQKLNYRFDLIDPHAIYMLAGVLSAGAEKYGEENWRNIPARDHVNHAIEHLYAWLAGDTNEPHMSHALTRVMFAQAVEGLD